MRKKFRGLIIFVVTGVTSVTDRRTKGLCGNNCVFQIVTVVTGQTIFGEGNNGNK